jgi:hypothetical protein
MEVQCEAAKVASTGAVPNEGNPLGVQGTPRTSVERA